MSPQPSEMPLLPLDAITPSRSATSDSPPPYTPPPVSSCQPIISELPATHSTTTIYFPNDTDLSPNTVVDRSTRSKDDPSANANPPAEICTEINHPSFGAASQISSSGPTSLKPAVCNNKRSRIDPNTLEANVGMHSNVLQVNKSASGDGNRKCCYTVAMMFLIILISSIILIAIVGHRTTYNGY